MLKAVPLTATSQNQPHPPTTNPDFASSAAASPPPGLPADYATLFKVRVTAMVLITSAAGFYLGSLRSGISPFNVCLLYTSLNDDGLSAQPRQPEPAACRIALSQSCAMQTRLSLIHI